MRGETIVGVEPPGLGYCRRGIDQLVEGKTPDAALPIVERTCSHAHEAYRIALCRALEAAGGSQVSEIAEATRTVFAEIEFLLARLWTLALATRATGTISLYRLALDQRESLFAALEAATGKRQYWAVAVPGGARVDLQLAPLREVLTSLEPGLAAWKAIVAPGGLVGRACNQVGIISAEQLGAIVPESDATYADYRTGLAGDVTSRLTRAADDLVACHVRAQAALAELDEQREEISATPAIPSTSSPVTATSVSSPHGPIRLSFHLTSNGNLHEPVLETPETFLVGALPQLLEGRLLLQVPLILASLDLCVECLDQ